MRGLLATVVIIFLTLISFAAKSQQEQIDTISYVPHVAIEKHYLAIIKKAYAQIGLYPDFIPINDKRSLLLLNDGEIDGDVARSEDIIDKHSMLIKVPPSLGRIEVSLLCQLELDCSPDVFQNDRLILGVIARDEYYDRLLADSKLNVVEVGTYERLDAMFKQKRLDAIIMVFDLNTSDPTSYANRYSLESKQGYHLIHKRHNQIVPELSKALAQAIKSHDFSD